MRRRLVLLAVLAVTAAGAALVAVSAATFTYSSSVSISVSTDTARNWMHMYSQSTDPQGDTGYAVQVGTATPAATGADFTIAANLGDVPNTNNANFYRLAKVLTVPAYPVAGVTTVTITVTVTPDSTTGKQPITAYGVATWGSQAFNTSLAGIAVNTKLQLNLRVRFNGGSWVAGTTYYPHAQVTLTYTGFTTTYYQYDMPITVKFK
jgi:hypothetical protein